MKHELQVNLSHYKKKTLPSKYPLKGLLTLNTMSHFLKIQLTEALETSLF